MSQLIYVLISTFIGFQSFYYSFFIISGCLLLLASQFPFIWSTVIIFSLIPFFMGVRSFGLATYNLLSFVKIFKTSVPKDLPKAVKVFVTPFIFIGEFCSQMIRPVTLVLRLLVNLTLAFLVSMFLGSCLVESLLSLSCYFFIFLVLSVLYSFYEFFMCCLLTFVSHSMFLSLITDLRHLLGESLFGKK
uniref:ATP synthase F0 subunit 6 n=1 Tax=Eudiplozoon nipponicum TaxID=116851 RepID=UPI001F139CAE|nr:ATP synthase F0 subunit 6 [Eudiplozoon nipponicum]UKQ56156.1 ATP synthase F0 subunit 6 [Eudiplozoon nipponicum]